MYIPDIQKDIQKIYFDLEIIAFDLVSLDTRFYLERILVIGYQYDKNTLKISNTTKTELFELISFQSDQKIWQKYCRADLSSLSDPLAYWLSISVLTRGFLGI